MLGLLLLLLTRKKLIKQAKEKVDDPKWVPTVEQIIARENVIKTVMLHHQSQISKMMSKSENSKNLLGELFSQMNYNELKKQKISQGKDQIWSKFVDKCVETSNSPEAHVKSVCKKYKIVL